MSQVQTRAVIEIQNESLACAVVWLSWPILNLMKFENTRGSLQADYTKVVMEFIGAFARILFLWLLWKSAPDQRCFMLKVITKLVTVVYLPFALAVVIAFGEASTLVFVGFHDSFFLALFFSLLGLEGTLALPCGPCSPRARLACVFV